MHLFIHTASFYIYFLYLFSPLCTHYELPLPARKWLKFKRGGTTVSCQELPEIGSNGEKGWDAMGCQ